MNELRCQNSEKHIPGSTRNRQNYNLTYSSRKKTTFSGFRIVSGEDLHCRIRRTRLRASLDYDRQLVFPLCTMHATNANYAASNAERVAFALCQRSVHTPSFNCPPPPPHVSELVIRSANVPSTIQDPPWMNKHRQQSRHIQTVSHF